MPARILVLSAAVGAGHMRAAQAIELALRKVVPNATIENRDVLEMTTASFRQIYGKAYLDLVNKAPHFLGYFYDMLDRPSRSGKNRTDQLRLAWQQLNLKPFLRFIQEQPWQLVINTHFLPAEMIASLRKKKELDLPQVMATTDFETHRMWVHQPCDAYFTATDEGALYLRSWGVPDSVPVEATGIPIHPVFTEAKERAGCLKRQGLSGDRPIILQLAGGFGVGPIEKLFQSLLQVEVPIELVVVTGRNEKVRASLQAISVPDRHKVHILGFTDQIDELMAVADLVVSKPGGLTTSEALARGAAMVIVNPIPGQESRNSDFLLENGAAIKANNLATLAFKVTQLLRDPKRLDQLKKNARNLGRPNAAFDIVQRSLALIKHDSAG